MTKLAETQTIFWRLISAPEGVAAGLAALPDRDRLLPLGLEGLVRGDDRLGAVERLDIYANMYFFRLLDCLAEDFPALHAIVGHEQFHGLAAGYLALHPSEHPSVRMLGAALGDFLESHSLSVERPYLADLARFEWALLGAFDAPDEPPLPDERLKGLPAEDWPSARFRLTPSLRIVEARAPVQEIWAAAKEGHELPALGGETARLRVWRQDLRVFHRSIDELELAALRAVAAGRDFATVCEDAAALDEGGAAAQVVMMLQRWFADGMVVGVTVGS